MKKKKKKSNKLIQLYERNISIQEMREHEKAVGGQSMINKSVHWDNTPGKKEGWRG